MPPIELCGSLSGHRPATTSPEEIDETIAAIDSTKTVQIDGDVVVPFHEEKDLLFHYNQSLPYHPNGMTFSAFDDNNQLLFQKSYYSVGGGFVVTQEEADTAKNVPSSSAGSVEVPIPFTSAAELLSACDHYQIGIDEVVHRNELTWRTEEEIASKLNLLWEVMDECIERGCRNEGVLPGGLKVRRRAPEIARRLLALSERSSPRAVPADPLTQLDWVSLFALAVNEENAAGGRVVTAPTNGAAGVIPAVLAYYVRFYPNASEKGVHQFLKTAARCRLVVQTQRIAFCC